MNVKIYVLFIIFLAPVFLLAQKQDTLVIVVDKSYEKVEVYNTSRKYKQKFFVVSIKSSYYGKDDDFATTHLEELLNDWGDKIEVNQPKLSLLKKDLANYESVTDKWIAKQTNFRKLEMKLGIIYRNRKTVYLVFKDELNCSRKDTVNLHQVLIGFNVVYD